MGLVYAAHHVRTGQPVAIKWLMSTPPERQFSALQRFEREASLASNIESNHIVRVVDVGRDRQGLSFIVMERFEGEDLQTMLDREGALVPELALRIAAQTCLGLDDAHRAGAIHRDIKPSNLFLARLDNTTVVKILDFGIAKIQAGHPDSANSAREYRTTQGRIMGSPFFLSPEQLLGKPDIDQQADVFSLGITLHTMLVGSVPFPDVKHFVQFLLHTATNQYKPVREQAPGLCPRVAAIVERATQVERELRYPSARAMYDAIAEVLGGDATLHQSEVSRAKWADARA